MAAPHSSHLIPLRRGRSVFRIPGRGRLQTFVHILDVLHALFLQPFAEDGQALLGEEWNASAHVARPVHPHSSDGRLLSHNDVSLGFSDDLEQFFLLRGWDFELVQ